MKKRTLFKSVLSTLLSLIIFCAFISVAQAQDFDPSRSGSGVIFTGDHDKFSLGSPLKSKDGAIVGVSSDVILTFNNGKEKKELNLTKFISLIPSPKFRITLKASLGRPRK